MLSHDRLFLTRLGNKVIFSAVFKMANIIDPFHEARQALESARHEYSTVSSLSLVGVFSPVHACDLALRALFALATGEEFRHDDFKPYHQPTRLAEQLGIKGEYTKESQKFLDKLQGYALHEVRYPETQAYKNYVQTRSYDLAKEVMDGTDRFIVETEQLATRDSVVEIIKQKAGMRKVVK